MMLRRVDAPRENSGSNGGVSPTAKPVLAAHFVHAASDARAQGDMLLAEHLLEVAFDLFEAAVRPDMSQ